VIDKLSATAKGAIKETYKVLLKRIDKFGVAQPNINLDEKRGIITVELAGVDNPDRVKKLLQASAHLQFWEVYNIEELAPSLKVADDALHNYLNGVSDTAKVEDTTLKAKNINPFFRIINPIDVQTDKSGKQFLLLQLEMLHCRIPVY
jgi:SecD/SecF fusion protein